MTPRVPSVEEQTGWKRRMGPVALCQDSDVLAAISEYDFDLRCEAFCAYAYQRGLGGHPGAVGSPTRRLIADHSATRDDFFAEKSFRHSMAGMPYSDAYMDTFWRIFLIRKGALQDCWEIWRATQLAPLTDREVREAA